METIITPLNPQNVIKVWPEVSRLIKPLLDESKTHSSDDVLKLLIGGTAQLWVQWNGHIEVALITRFEPYPQAISLRIWMAAALDEDKTNWEEWRVVLVGFAAQNNCSMIEAEGREGWEKLLGIKKVGCTYRVHLTE